MKIINIADKRNGEFFEKGLTAQKVLVAKWFNKLTQDKFVEILENLALAVEENGVTYHHPQIIGVERYKNQLRKQNTCALWGIKLFRFSSEDCAFDNRIEDDIKQFFGKDTSGFVDNGLKIDRPVELYEHQTVSLQEIQQRREAGIKAFLIVLPTAAGKSRIVEEDLREFSKKNHGFKGLILVPGVNILADWEERIKTSLPELVDKIDIRTYAFMARHYTDFQTDYYSYVVVDEAHHAVAPVLKRVIQYFNSDFTIAICIRYLQIHIMCRLAILHEQITYQVSCWLLMA